MTPKQYSLLIQYASDLRSALYAYEDEQGIINLKTDPISEIAVAAAKLTQAVDSIEPIFSSDEAHEDDIF